MRPIWKGLWKDPVSGLALLWLITLSTTALMAYFIAPVSTEYANEMLPSKALVPPGTKTLVYVQRDAERSSWDRFTGGQVQPVQIHPVADFQKKDVAYDLLLEGRPDAVGFRIRASEDELQQRTFWLGTDRYGRDVLSRLIIGARISLSVGFVAVLISLLIGVPLGAIAGFYGGRVDSFIQWLLQVVWSIPTLLLVIALTLALGKGHWQVFIAIGLTMWVEVARVLRGEVKSQSKREYVDAAVVQGFSSLYILRKHVLPNSWAPLIVVSAANFAAAILMESGLSFLGLGAQPPVPSWGGMIRDHYSFILMGKPWLSLAPGILIMLTVLSFMMIGNRLRDLLDVRNG
ncbi:MAG: ABC transporter permease [Flavobacteriia bacterium]|jgi:peptide/nickel transport system permease protein|nr:ABC transporter permease [Flavobacteriia bacterium]